MHKYQGSYLDCVVPKYTLTYLHLFRNAIQWFVPVVVVAAVLGDTVSSVLAPFSSSVATLPLEVATFPFADSTLSDLS